VEFAGALYHALDRNDRPKTIFLYQATFGVEHELTGGSSGRRRHAHDSAYVGNEL